MRVFLLCILILVAGFIIYSRFIERFFGADAKRETPAIRLNDGVDYIPMKPWRMFMIQFLNIAGLGPIFGAILGAMYGPWAYVWIVLGCVFMGSVHDYFSGMLSIRHDGASLPEIVGIYLGNGMQKFLRVFSLLLLVFVGVAFVTGPAGLLDTLFGGGKNVWLYLIFAYYLMATLLPIDKIIGKIYPLFGMALLIMAVGIAGALVIKGVNGELAMGHLALSDFKNWHSQPQQNILYPMMFIVISCGALSGFHSTQSPMMARCMTNEKQGRYIFFGAMIAEGIVAIIWATAAMNYFGGPHELNALLADGSANPTYVVKVICNSWLGRIGAVFAIIGVIACPITTGDTAFRSARLTIADMFKIPQGSIRKRLYISIPLFGVGFLLGQMGFATIWKYVGISNQILAVTVLWAGAHYLVHQGKKHWLLSLPALFMTTVCSTYLLVAPYENGGMELSVEWGFPLGVLIGLFVMGLFWVRAHREVAVVETTES